MKTADFASEIKANLKLHKAIKDLSKFMDKIYS